MWAPGSSAPSCGDVCGTLGAAKHREAVVDDYKSRRDPMLVCKDISIVRPWMVELRRAPPTESRSVLQRAKKHLAPEKTSDSEDVLGQGSDIPSDGTS